VLEMGFQGWQNQVRVPVDAGRQACPQISIPN